MSRTRRNSNRRRWVSQGLTLTLALGLLLWVKLRLVTNVTRTAYADPDAKHVQPNKPRVDAKRATPAEPADAQRVD